VSGVIVPDLAVEEGGALRAAGRKHRFAIVHLAAPTSPPERLRRIARASQGFIYYVSVTGTTGARRELSPTLLHGLRQLRLLTTKPVCVGFGISTPAQAKAVGAVADGVIVGSALVRALAEGPRRGAVARVSRLARRLRKALDR
jgi:tryptophan synthase alpha chain